MEINGEKQSGVGWSFQMLGARKTTALQSKVVRIRGSLCVPWSDLKKSDILNLSNTFYIIEFKRRNTMLKYTLRFLVEH